MAGGRRLKLCPWGRGWYRDCLIDLAGTGYEGAPAKQANGKNARD
jgi:hypothetical protein